MDSVIYETKKGLKFSVLDEKRFNGATHWKIVFLETKHIKWVNKYNALRGEVRDPLNKELCGVGFLGEGWEDLPKNTRISNCWSNMIRRCYDSNMVNYKYYGGKGVKVHQEWFCYKTFYQWYIENLPQGGVQSDYELDKDLLTGGESFLYSPDTCSLIPTRLNRVIRMAEEDRGVTKCPDGSGKYRARWLSLTLPQKKEKSKRFIRVEDAKVWLKANRDKEALEYIEKLFHENKLLKRSYNKLRELYE